MSKSGLIFLTAGLLAILPADSRSETGPPHTGEIAVDFEAAARWLADKRLPYGAVWVPPGQESGWRMDCSNTARWIYQQATGLQLPRTASDQYAWLRAKKRLWRVRPDARELARKLRPGDLLFWEHTYRPKRRPPVTHVMVYLGRDQSGRMIMAGAQGSRGAGLYEFRPSIRYGGYRAFLWFRRHGKFVAYGRPL